jgi:hypothetical protein
VKAIIGPPQAVHNERGATFGGLQILLSNFDEAPVSQVTLQETLMSSVPRRQRSARRCTGFDRQLIDGEWTTGNGKGHVNDQPVNDLANRLFGGEKNSGIGRFGGDWAVEAFTTDKWVTIQYVPRRFPTGANVLSGPWAGG